MKSKIYGILGRVVSALAVPAVMFVSACTAEPDDSNLYTMTGETIEDFLVRNDSTFSNFNYILTRSGYDRLLGTYGPYTCFAPTNDAVQTYIDSLYDDAEARIEHNGMTERSLEGLSDSLCTDIVQYHLLNQQEVMEADMSIGSSLLPILGREISISSKLADDGKSYTVLSKSATIIEADNELTNGVVHVIDKVIPRSNRMVNEEFLKRENFSIFNEALILTGLADSVSVEKKDVSFANTKPAATSGYYIPEECKAGFTIFAESNSVFNAKNIYTIDDLIDSANVWYAKAATGSKSSSINAKEGWYDYYRNNGIQISTGTDYTKSNNALNMFVRYHILKSALAENVLAFDYNTVGGNEYTLETFGYSGDVYEYYETMLPKTLVKTWKINKKGSTDKGKIFLNRYVENNTLTDQVEGMGSESMHALKFRGVEILTDSAFEQSLNGYVYPIDQVLLYDARVPNGVLNERMRFDCLTLLPEISNNGFRGMTVPQLQAKSGNSSDSRVRFPTNFFDNVVVFNGDMTKIDMNVCAGSTGTDYTLYKGDSFQGMGVYDFAIKLPPVPDGTYELRLGVTNFSGSQGSMLQFYLGEAPSVYTMQAIDLPVDMRMDAYSDGGMSDARIVELGYVPCNDATNYPDAYEDRGVETDKIMRQHGYMRDNLMTVRMHGNHSASKGTTEMVGRFCAYQFRRIVVKRDFTQRDMWLRLKTVLPDETGRKFQLDYLEFCPVNIADNTRYMEDMY